MTAKINETKFGLSQKYADDFQDVAERCEKVAELRWELENQLEARIEVPSNN